MIHDIEAIRIVLVILCQKQDMQTGSARTVFRVAVHQLHNFFCLIRHGSVLIDAVIQIHRTDAVKDTNSDSTVSRCTGGLFKARKAGFIVAFRPLSAYRIVRNLCHSSVSLLRLPGTEQSSSL